ncbi:uncharacterized protein LOC101475037 isoform X1 [Maylandia zebra]|uniref:uncharacterized protein LOC101475037 isoform X1 n=1 Tax=Maylandia zebra TaxID=106582 RepID=UPI00403C866A
MRSFLILVFVSQHALAAKVEVYEGAESVLLPCRVGFLLEDTTVTWTRPDLDPSAIHRRHEDRDEPDGQNMRYRGRTAMRANEADPRDLSLTLSKPELSDTGSYDCIISKQKDVLKLTDVELQVKVGMLEVEVTEGSEFIQLPCQTTSPLPADTTVEWSRSEPIPMIVHVFPNSSAELPKKQDEFFCGRTRMREDSLKTGDLSLTLKYPSERDNGHYVCTINTGTDTLRQKVALQHVKKPFPTWATAFLSVMAISLVAGGGFVAYFWYYFKMVSTTEVDEGGESVHLQFKTTPNLPVGATVVWRRSRLGFKLITVHEYSNGESKPGAKYMDRTEMVEDPLTSGDLSLTLRRPRRRDSGIYLCTLCRGKVVLDEKRLRLEVRVPQVKVSEGVDVVLPWKTWIPPPEKATVEWSRHEPWPMIVHVYQSGSNCLEKQTWLYRGRTKMEDEDPRKNRNLSLVLREPTVLDSGEYTCTIKEEERVVRAKCLRLHVRDFNHISDDEENGEKTPLIRYRGPQSV